MMRTAEIVNRRSRLLQGPSAQVARTEDLDPAYRPIPGGQSSHWVDQGSMHLFLVVLPAILVVAVAATVVAWAAQAPRTAARTARIPNVILRVLEVYLLITGVGTFGIGVAGVATGSAASGISVAIGVVLLACWAITIRVRRHRERR